MLKKKKPKYKVILAILIMNSKGESNNTIHIIHFLKFTHSTHKKQFPIAGCSHKLNAAKNSCLCRFYYNSVVIPNLGLESLFLHLDTFIGANGSNHHTILNGLSLLCKLSWTFTNCWNFSS